MARTNATLRGRLESLSLSEIVQTVTLGHKTGRLTLRRRRCRGRIWFQEGKARHARAGTLAGEQAFIAMVGWTTGDFVFVPGKRTEEQTLEQDAMFLVMEGLRRLDEGTLAEHVVEPERRPLRVAALGIVLVVAALAVLLLTTLGSGSRAAPQPVEAGTIDGGFVAFGAPTWEAQLRTAADVAGDHAAFEFDALDPALYREQIVPVRVKDERRVEEITESKQGEGLSLDLESSTEEPFWMASLPERKEEGFLAISGRSRLKSGHLTILVNDEVVYDDELVNKRRGLFRKREDQTFETNIPMAGGTHEVVARLQVDGRAERYENRITVDVEPGATRNLALFARRYGGRYLLSLD